MDNKDKVIAVIKPVGKTPLWAVERIKTLNPGLKNTTVSYAGRLDPMAEGVLLLLIGDENKKRREYEGLTKTYIVKIVLGLSSDTFDTLGIVGSINTTKIGINKIKKILKEFIGKKTQIYPPYSSKTVRGKPLYWWAREKRLSEIELPKRDIEIKSISLIKHNKVLIDTLYKKIIKTIHNIDGNFRQEQITHSWDKVYKDYKGNEFNALTLEVSCSSGTYMRRLCSDLGEKLSCGALCLSIKRTRLGEYTLKDAISLV